jgi:hypothetical protein
MKALKDMGFYAAFNSTLDQLTKVISLRLNINNRQLSLITISLSF